MPLKGYQWIVSSNSHSQSRVTLSSKLPFERALNIEYDGMLTAPYRVLQLNESCVCYAICYISLDFSKMTARWWRANDDKWHRIIISEWNIVDIYSQQLSRTWSCKNADLPKTVSFSWWWTTDGQELAQNRVLSYENTQVIIPHLRCNIRTRLTATISLLQLISANGCLILTHHNP